MSHEDDDALRDEERFEDDEPETDDYLWDRSGAVDEDIAALEEVLGVLRYDAAMPAVDRPVERPKPHAIWWLAVAAGVGLIIWGWLAREGAEVAPPVARMNIPVVSPSAGLGAPTGSQPVPLPASPPRGPAWNVAAVSGVPTAGGAPVDQAGKLYVGQWVETGEGAQARVSIPEVGTLDVEPGSRLRLIGTRADQHRVELARGLLRVTIDAAPRVFVVDAPNVTYVDLGCAYQLEVAEDGSSWLRVRTGWVAVETQEVVSVVGADAMCHAGGDGTPGLPLRRSAAAAYVDAATRFVAGATDAVSYLVSHAQAGDETTLWHLLSRVPASERRAVYDKLVAIASAPPDEASVLRTDKDALDGWGRLLGVLPPPDWAVEGPPDPPAPQWQPEKPLPPAPQLSPVPAPQWQPDPAPSNQWQPDDQRQPRDGRR